MENDDRQWQVLTGVFEYKTYSTCTVHTAPSTNSTTVTKYSYMYSSTVLLYYLARAESTNTVANILKELTGQRPDRWETPNKCSSQQATFPHDTGTLNRPANHDNHTISYPHSTWCLSHAAWHSISGTCTNQSPMYQGHDNHTLEKHLQPLKVWPNLEEKHSQNSHNSLHFIPPSLPPFNSSYPHRVATSRPHGAVSCLLQWGSHTTMPGTAEQGMVGTSKGLSFPIPYSTPLLIKSVQHVLLLIWSQFTALAPFGSRWWSRWLANLKLRRVWY
jgi:hypothetical protein